MAEANQASDVVLMKHKLVTIVTAKKGKNHKILSHLVFNVPARIHIIHQAVCLSLWKNFKLQIFCILKAYFSSFCYFLRPKNDTIVE